MNEKKEIEEYMKLYCLEQCLDEIMNIIVVDKPTNPYMEISKLFQSKTLPEIIDISFQPIIISGTTGVRAVLLTCCVLPTRDQTVAVRKPGLLSHIVYQLSSTIYLSFIYHLSSIFLVSMIYLSSSFLLSII